MEIVMARAVTYSVILMLTFAFFVGCNMDFLSDSGGDSSGGPECPNHPVGEDRNGDGLVDEQLVYDCNDELQYWVEYRYDDQDRMIGKRRHLPNDAVQWTRLYTYDDAGNRTLEAFYLPEGSGDGHDLQYYVRSAHDADGNLTEQAEFDASGTLQWYEAYEYENEEVARRARFDGDVEPVWLNAYEYVEFSGETLVSVQESYSYLPAPNTGAQAAGLQSARSLSVTANGAYAFDDVSLPDTVSEFPSPETSNLQQLQADGSMVLEWTQRWWYREGGSYSVRYDGESKPLLLTIADENLDRDIEVTVDYPNDGPDDSLPESKVTTYGDTEVLNLGFTYTEQDGVTLLESLSVTGESVLLPAVFHVEYNDDSVPNLVEIRQPDGDLLQYFQYEYEPGSTADAETSVGAGFDPVDFGGRVDTITQFDGDDNELGRYVFTYDDENGEIRIDGEQYDAEEQTYSDTGYFLLTLDAEGRTAEFASFDSNDERIWYYNYEYDDAGYRVDETRFEVPEGGGAAEPAVPAGLGREDLFLLLFG
jgi:hypothetical protein